MESNLAYTMISMRKKILQVLLLVNGCNLVKQAIFLPAIFHNISLAIGCLLQEFALNILLQHEIRLCHVLRTMSSCTVFLFWDNFCSTNSNNL